MAALSKKQALIRLLTTRIDQSNWQLLTPEELAREVQLTEGEWLARVDAFLDDPLNGIPGGEEAQRVTTALLAKRFARNLSKELVELYTRPLKPTPTHKGKKINIDKLCELLRSVENTASPSLKAKAKARRDTQRKKKT